MKSTTEIQVNQSTALLKALHILTRDGQLNQDSRRKLKQVNHLVQFIAPIIYEVAAKNAEFSLVDHGAGKSYLGFMLYDAIVKNLASGTIIGVESRADLVEKSRQLAADCGFTRMQFADLTVLESQKSQLLPPAVDIVTALHACNTATDDAIQFGLAKQAQFMALVPCCQAEVAAALKMSKSKALSSTPLSELWRHPIHTRELGSQLTNVLRCLQLEAHGYSVSVTELIGWEHSMKNELIIAKYTGEKRGNARERAQKIIDEFQLQALAARFL